MSDNTKTSELDEVFRRLKKVSAATLYDIIEEWIRNSDDVRLLDDIFEQHGWTREEYVKTNFSTNIWPGTCRN